MYSAPYSHHVQGTSPYQQQPPSQFSMAPQMHTMPNTVSYQTPYTSIPYNASMPAGNPQAYQAMMQPPPPSSTPNSHSSGLSRASPYPAPSLPHQMSPPNMSNPQFAPPPSQAHQPTLMGQQQHQNLHQSQQSISQNIGGNQNHGGQNQQQANPSTPTTGAPLSPASESREKQRVTLLLDINRDLLMEVMRLQALQREIRKEAGGDPGPDSKFAEKKNQAQKDYGECMRRLQHNLAYLAAIADRSHKPAAQIPHHPVPMFAPPLSQASTSFNFSSPMMTNAVPKTDPTSSPNNPASVQKTEAEISNIDKESRLNSLKESYRQLQELFGLTDAECKKEEMQQVKGRMQQAQQQQQQQMYSQNQQQQQQMPSNQLPNNMSMQAMQMQGQGHPQQMNMGMNPAAMGMSGMPGMGVSMSMPGQLDMAFQRGGLPGGGMR